MRSQATALRSKDLLGIESLTPEEISLILDTAEGFREVSERPIKKVPTLRGQLVINLFMEASTRTRVSFEIAEKRLSADTLNFSASGSSVEKGETLLDTAENLMAMQPDMIVIRHKHPGSPKMLADLLGAEFIAAADDGQPVTNSELLHAAPDHARLLGVPVIDHATNDIVHVVGLVGIVGNDLEKCFIATVARIACVPARRLIDVVRGHEPKQVANVLEAGQLRRAREMRHAAG